MKKESKKLAYKLSSFGIKLKKWHLKKIEKYVELLSWWNEKINLIAKNDFSRIYDYHLFDCLLISKYIKQNAEVADWGAGAGLPGIPIAILRNDVQMHLIESKRKKAAFLLRAVEELELSNAKVWAKRGEEVELKFDTILLRQVGKIKKVLPQVIEKVKEKGEIIFFKGENFEQEIKNAEKLINRYNLEWFYKTFYLPGTVKRIFLFFKRRKN